MFDHFLAAQDPVYDAALAELRAGQKRSHWMWFIFPQVAGLGYSPTAKRFALLGVSEARAYLADPVLGSRLRQATAAVLAHSGQSLYAIFGTPDDRKFVSCMTLFHRAAPEEKLFAQALAAFAAGQEDEATLARL